VVHRSEFEAQIGRLIARIEGPIVDVLTHAGVEKEGIFAIEVHGGASRVPAVKAKITEIFGREPTQSLNPDECFASGAGFQAAMLLPHFRVPLKVTDITIQPIKIEYFDPASNERVEKELFAQFQPIPSTKNITLKVVGTNMLRIISDTLIGTVTLRTGVDELLSVKVRVVLTRDALVEVVSATRRPGDDDETRDDRVPVEHTYAPEFGLPADTIAMLQEEESVMRAQDELEERIDVTRNELESSIFTLQAGLAGDLKPFLTEDELRAAAEEVGRVSEWFSEHEFERQSVDEYSTRLRALKEVGDPALQRKRQHESLPDLLQGIADRVRKLLGTVEANDATNKAPLITDITGFIERVTLQRNEVLAVPPFVMPVADPKAEETRLRALEKRAKRLAPAKSPPPPTPQAPEVAESASA
jgi:heat shock protein 4